MEYMTLDIILAVVLSAIVIYCVIMIGLSSGQGPEVEYSKKEVSSVRNAIKTKYNVA